MAVVGESPSDGVRLELHRDAVNVGAPWRYSGTLARAGGQPAAVEAELAEAGAVVVSPTCALEPEERERVERTLRMALKHARQEDPSAPPPRRITRWRGEEGR